MASCNYFLFISVCLFCVLSGRQCRKLSENDLFRYRDRVVRMFQHAYNGYLKYAYPLDELRPLTCDGHDTWGSYSLTLIDALDTLAVMGNYSEFRRVTKLLENTLDFDRDINVSVFETNIRVVGGLLSAHLLSRRAGVDLEPGWPCSGPLLRLAENVARKLLPAFNTSTSMPYGTVNLLYGIPKGETPVTCTAGVGTFIVEFGALSQLTGLPIYLDVAIRALHGLWTLKSPIGLVGNHIDVVSGKWTALDSGIGAGVDSYFEYLVKGSILLPYPELMEMFQGYKQALTKYLKREDWYMWAHMDKGTITLPIFQSLEAFWPGLLSLTGDVDSGMKTLHNYHQIWRQYGFVPEFYNIPKAEVQVNREGFPLRPELIESVMYLYRATKDPYLLEVAVDILESIEHSTRTPCGHATVKNVRDHQLENRMESFFLAETTKYLYLIFDTENFIHNTGSHGSVVTTPQGRCVIDAGGYVFNTEAHPIDAGALYCCSALRKQHLDEAENVLSRIDLLQLMNVREERKNHVVRRRRQKKTEETEENEEQGEAEKMEENEESRKEEEKIEETQERREEVDMNSFPDELKEMDNEGTNDMTNNAETVEDSSAAVDSGSCEQSAMVTSDNQPDLEVVQESTPVQAPLTPLQVIPPDGSCLKTSTNEMPSSSSPVTVLPADLWTLRISINNRTEQELVNRLFTCPSRPFHARWSLMGEMFIDE